VEPRKEEEEEIDNLLQRVFLMLWIEASCNWRQEYLCLVHSLLQLLCDISTKCIMCKSYPFVSMFDVRNCWIYFDYILY